jgi:diaminopimelate epimerase
VRVAGLGAAGISACVGVLPWHTDGNMRLTKHHGLGNDFLVVLDAAGHQPILPAEARALCDRRTGIGADGVIRATPGPAAAGPVPLGSPPRTGRSSGRAEADRRDLPSGAVAVMELTNADGSPAEMSGNGIRCLAQALVRAGWATGSDIPILTAVGLRTVRRGDDLDPVTQRFAVDMGAVRIGAEAPEWAVPGVARALTVDVGNPHLVLELAGDPDGPEPDLVEVGETANAKIAGGINVHLLRTDDAGGITIRTFERGVGPTLACGTGACASAAAALHWGLAGGTVRVTMGGGEVDVALADAAPVGTPTGEPEGQPAVLTGPAAFVAAIDTDPAASTAASKGRAARDVPAGNEGAPCH